MDVLLRRHLRRLWLDYQWHVAVGLWLITLCLGYVGFAQHFAGRGEARSPLDLLYLTLQLFPLQSGAISPPVAWELQMARFLAPIVATYTALCALAQVFYHQLQVLGLRFVRGHVVICGLGRKGWLLTRGFLFRGERVVVLETDEANDYIELCREQGATVLVGSATDTELLRKAAVHKARYVISLCGDDSINAEVAVRARSLIREYAGQALTCAVHIVDPQLYHLLRERELTLEGGKPFRLEFLNIFDLGAQLLLKEYPAFEPVTAARGQSPHVVVIGLGRMGESLVIHLAREWWRRRCAEGARLRISIVDRAAQAKVASLCLRYPRLEQACDLMPHQVEIRSPEFERAAFLCNVDRECDVSSIYVCLDNDSLGLMAGLTLLQRLRGRKVPIVVRLAQEGGLATLLCGGASHFENLRAFGLLDRTCCPDLVLGGTHEMLARAIHEEYLRRQSGAGDTRQTNPALVPWDQLPEALKESNRHQADHIGVKLRAVGYGIGPLTDWEAEEFEFTAEEVELMAQMEHQRFLQERSLSGWTYTAGEKDLESKRSPVFVPWDELPEAEKEKDRNVVRALPRFLAQAGLQVYRLS